MHRKTQRVPRHVVWNRKDWSCQSKDCTMDGSNRGLQISITNNRGISWLSDKQINEKRKCDISPWQHQSQEKVYLLRATKIRWACAYDRSRKSFDRSSSIPFIKLARTPAACSLTWMYKNKVQTIHKRNLHCTGLTCTLIVHIFMIVQWYYTFWVRHRMGKQMSLYRVNLPQLGCPQVNFLLFARFVISLSQKVWMCACEKGNVVEHFPLALTTEKKSETHNTKVTLLLKKVIEILQICKVQAVFLLVLHLWSSSLTFFVLWFVNSSTIFRYGGNGKRWPLSKKKCWS